MSNPFGVMIAVSKGCWTLVLNNSPYEQTIQGGVNRNNL
jgi:hypothetical protein